MSSTALALYVRDHAIVQANGEVAGAGDPSELAARPPCVRPASRP